MVLVCLLKLCLPKIRLEGTTQFLILNATISLFKTHLISKVLETFTLTLFLPFHTEKEACNPPVLWPLTSRGRFMTGGVSLASNATSLAYSLNIITGFIVSRYKF